jgi:hypothetical protein
MQHLPIFQKIKATRDFSNSIKDSLHVAHTIIAAAKVRPAAVFNSLKTK